MFFNEFHYSVFIYTYNSTSVIKRGRRKSNSGGVNVIKVHFTHV
jgi:hypothetical protein